MYETDKQLVVAENPDGSLTELQAIPGRKFPYHGTEVVVMKQGRQWASMAAMMDAIDSSHAETIEDIPADVLDLEFENQPMNVGPFVITRIH